jgi:hypothetical protein
MGILRPYPYNDIVSQMTIKFKVYFHYFLPFIPEKAIIPPGASPEGLYTQKQFDCTFIYAHPKKPLDPILFKGPSWVKLPMAGRNSALPDMHYNPELYRYAF